MEQLILRGRMLSPMYSYGAYQGIGEKNQPAGQLNKSGVPEFRASELKGTMRRLYRMAYPDGLKTLAEKESDLFGGMVGKTDTTQGHASPIQLLVESDQADFVEEQLLCHKEKNNPIMKRPDDSWESVITVRANKRVKISDTTLAGIADLNWYKDLIMLALLLCGVGKRSRKGRGRVEITEPPFEDEAQALGWICKVLNNLAATAGTEYTDYYHIIGNQIEPDKPDCPKPGQELFPTILRIRLGQKLHTKIKEPGSGGVSKQSISCINGYLWAVDKTCHDWKYENIKNYSPEKPFDDPIGSGKPRFASSLLIGFIRIKEDIYPLYTFVRAITRGGPTKNKGVGYRSANQQSHYEIDQNCRIRESFINQVMLLYDGKGMTS